MSAYTPPNLDQQWKAKQTVMPSRSPVYQNLQSAMNPTNFETIDDLPLPPPPDSSHSATSWSTEQMSTFPPPPPEMNYPYDINGNQFRPEKVIEGKSENSLYANLRPRPIVAGTHDASVCELISDLSLTANPSFRSRVYPESDLDSAYASVPITSSQSSIYPSFNSRSSANSNSPSDIAANKAKQQSDRAIYANLSNSHFGGPTFKPNPAPKSYLRVNRSSANKEEAEVDHLTDLLVKSMENSAEPDFFGMCNKCGEKVVGEGSGCTAMEMVYHIQCFTCFDCHKELRGKSFYAMDSNPFCEECYLNTLEKCCVCEKAILDRILRATGQPYHPNCFTCVVCKKCLDGIPFTVDASNQIHCIDDFHKKFAPRCSVCNEPIVPEAGKTETVRVVALDRSFHVSCYKCEDCDLLLSSETEGRGCYPLDDHILCRSCNAKRVQAISAN